MVLSEDMMYCANAQSLFTVVFDFFFALVQCVLFNHWCAKFRLLSFLFKFFGFIASASIGNDEDNVVSYLRWKSDLVFEEEENGDERWFSF